MRRALFAVVLLEVTACRKPASPVVPPAPEDAGVGGCEASTGSRAPLRRLTAHEYDATVRDLLGATAKVGATFPPVEGLGFSTAADAQTPSAVLAERQLEAAERLSESADLTHLLPCAVDDSCADQFISAFGRRVFRRTLTDDEHARFASAYQVFRRTETPERSYRMLLEAFLQAPQFLFRLEPHLADQGPAIRLTGFEVATRLSYFLWGSTPDDALLDAAEAGQLDSAAGVRAQAMRLLRDAKAREAVRQFHIEWLGAQRLATAAKSAAYPMFDQLKGSMAEEVGRFGEWAVFENGKASALFNGKVAVINGDLAALYGIPGVEGPEFRQVSLDFVQRGGVLTLPGVLAAWAKADQSSPVQRGKFVRERLLCETLPTPPGNVVTDLPPPTSNTTRARYAAHVTNDACKQCHEVMDPVGFGFEHYDAIGAYRNTENGHVIDAKGEVLHSRDVDGTFDGALALGQKLAGSSAARDCLVTQWFRSGLGRGEDDADACTLQRVRAEFSGAQGDLQTLLVALAASDAFRFRAPDEGGAP